MRTQVVSREHGYHVSFAPEQAANGGTDDDDEIRTNAVSETQEISVFHRSETKGGQST